MNVKTFDDILTQLKEADYPQDVFGSLDGVTLDQLQTAYRRLAMLVHPDRNPGREHDADDAFVLLQKWYAFGRREIERLTHGQARPNIRISSTRTRYAGNDYALRGDLCELYPVESDGTDYLLKVTRNAINNDLLEAETKALRLINRKLAGEPLRVHFPTLHETFLVADENGVQRRTNALVYETELITLQDIIDTHPSGVHPADAAWMFNRVLTILGLTHSFGLVHGAVIPAHILLNLRDHNGMLIDWCYSVDLGGTIPAVSLPNKAYYAPEVLAKKETGVSADLYMAAQCMVKLLGGDLATGTLPERVPLPIKKLLESCLIQSPHRRANDAWELFEAFNEILKKLYGKPKFRTFRMPK